MAKHHMAHIFTFYLGAGQSLAHHLSGQLGGGDVFETATVSANGGPHTADHNNFTTHAFLLLCVEPLL